MIASRLWSFRVRWLHGFNRMNIVALLVWVEKVSRSRPTSEFTRSIDGFLISICSIRPTTSSVRGLDAASGSWTASTKKPLSSDGMKAPGTFLNSTTTRATITANAASPARGLPTIRPAARR